jgi:hypothetical protein
MREATLLVGLQATGAGCLAEQSRGPESEFLDFLAVAFGVRKANQLEHFADCVFELQLFKRDINVEFKHSIDLSCDL